MLCALGWMVGTWPGRAGGGRPPLRARGWGMHPPLPSFAFPACPALPAPQLSPGSSCGPSFPKPLSASRFEDAVSPSHHTLSPFALSLCPLEWLSPSVPATRACPYVLAGLPQCCGGGRMASPCSLA